MQGNDGSTKKTVLLTGAMGFIGSCLAASLHRSGNYRLVLTDDLSATSRDKKARNIAGLEGVAWVDRSDLFSKLSTQQIPPPDMVIHIGARTDTTEFNKAIFDELNLGYTKQIWQYCAQQNIPLIYASSAATYGDGALGYDDAHSIVPHLIPLNPYGDSKNLFDQWALLQKIAPPFWYGLKFFNVYGPNEYHKGRMASVIFHAFHQFKKEGKVKLFRSHRNDFKDGEQLRDFIYVKDVVSVIEWLMASLPYSGIYNLGTGGARSFYDLAKNTAAAMAQPLEIEWIDIPQDIREKYQYFTEAKMDKLRAAGYDQPFTTLEAGIADYVQHYLMPDKMY